MVFLFVARSNPRKKKIETTKKIKCADTFVLDVYYENCRHIHLELLFVRDPWTLTWGDFSPEMKGVDFPTASLNKKNLMIPMGWRHRVRWLSQWGDLFPCLERWKYCLLKSPAVGCPTDMISLRKIVAMTVLSRFHLIKYPPCALDSSFFSRNKRLRRNSLLA